MNGRFKWRMRCESETRLPSTGSTWRRNWIRDRRDLFSRIEVLLTHLLKWRIEDLERSKSWRITIRNQRKAIRRLLGQSPSLVRYVDEAIEREYPDAAADAVEEMGLLQNPFPATCPFNAEQLLSDEYWPD